MDNFISRLARIMTISTAMPLQRSSDRGHFASALRCGRALLPARVLLLIVTFIGAVAYNDYGSPGSWFSDELTWVTAGMIRNGDMNPHFFAYPAGLQIYGTLFLYKIAHFFSHHPSDIDMYLLNGVARTLSAVFFVSGVFLFERSVACLARKRQDIFTLVIFAMSCAMIHHAHIGTAQTSLFFAIALTNYGIARTICSGNPKSYYITVLFCGIAIGTKYTGIYMSVCIPILYFSCFKSRRIVDVLVVLLSTALIGFLGTVIFNPFIVLDHKAFIDDVVMVSIKEAPMFVSQSSGAAYHASMTYFYLSAFFGPIARVIVIAIDAGAIVLATYILARKHLRAKEELRSMSKALVISTATLLAYFALEMAVNISQSRYYIPLGLGLAFMMCIGLNLAVASLSQFRQSWRTSLAVGSVWASGWLVAGSCIALGAAYVLVFPMSGHVRAFRYAAKALKADPTETVAQMSLHSRSAVHFKKDICAARCFSIISGYTGSDVDVSDMSSWDEYYSKVDAKLQKLNPDLVVMEDVFLYWNFMVPKGDHDYSDRFKMQNPGPKGFETALREAGYSLNAIIPRIDPKLKRYDPALDSAFDSSAEGVGGDIYLYKKIVRR